jgi:hypothetical protein
MNTDRAFRHGGTGKFGNFSGILRTIRVAQRRPATERLGRIAVDNTVTLFRRQRTIMRISCCLAALALACSPMTAGAQPVRWQRTIVPETGASVDVPVSVFAEEAGKPETGYGRRFLTSDRRANLTIQSIANEGRSPRRFLAEKNPPTDIVYKRVTDRFFVVSSFRNDMIWYNRCNFAGPYANCVLINYPAAEKRQWDGIVTRISNTLASR